MGRVRILAADGSFAEAQKMDRFWRQRSVQLQEGRDGLLVHAVSSIRTLADIEIEPFAQCEDQGRSEVARIRLAARINGLFVTDSADAIVITVNRDTLEETAYYLHLVLKGERPVILIESPCGASRLNDEGWMTLYDAVAVAADCSERGYGAVTILSDGFPAMYKAANSGAARGHTLLSAAHDVLAIVNRGEIRYFRHPGDGYQPDPQFCADLGERLPRVDILYCHADMARDVIAACICFGASGIVIGGAGNGSVPEKLARELAELANRGVVVVRSGLTERYAIGSESEEAAGLIEAEQLSPQQSRLLLQLCLAKGMDRYEIQQAFRRN